MKTNQIQEEITTHLNLHPRLGGYFVDKPLAKVLGKPYLELCVYTRSLDELIGISEIVAKHNCKLVLCGLSSFYTRLWIEEKNNV